MQHTTDLPPITLSVGNNPVTVRLAVAIEAPVKTVRHLLKVAALIAAGADLADRAAMLVLADAYSRAASHGQYSELIRTEMLRAELRARRIAALLPETEAERA